MHTQRKVILSAEMPQSICVNPSDLFSLELKQYIELQFS